MGEGGRGKKIYSVRYHRQQHVVSGKARDLSHRLFEGRGEGEGLAVRRNGRSVSRFLREGGESREVVLVREKSIS